jgi:hypothetical protein
VKTNDERIESLERRVAALERVSVEGRSEIGPQKGAQSLADEMREFAVELAGGTWTAFAASSAIEGFADRTDVLEADAHYARRYLLDEAEPADAATYRLHDLADSVTTSMRNLRRERDEARETVERMKAATTPLRIEAEPDSVSVNILPDTRPFQVAMLTTERDRLAAWKREALLVLTAYDDLAKRVVPNSTLGRNWSDLLAEHVDALTAERDRLAADIAIMRDADLTATDVQRRRAEKAEAERDEARAEAESLRRAAQVTTTSWREHVERADKAERERDEARADARIWRKHVDDLAPRAEKAEAAVARVRARIEQVAAHGDAITRCNLAAARFRVALDGVDAGGEGK